MSTTNDKRHFRLLIVDDSANIHEDFRKILLRTTTPTSVTDLESALFGESADPAAPPTTFELDSAYQGDEGVERVKAALESGSPYSLVFMDVRMPPGMDGITAIEKIWRVDPDVQVVVCSAYSDYSWAEIMVKLGQTDRLVILRKPFDNIEVLQLAHALTEKWNLRREVMRHVAQLENIVAERTQRLRESREVFQLILENTHDLISVLDEQGRHVYASPSHRKVLGSDPEALMGRCVLDRAHPEDVFRVQELLDRTRVTERLHGATFTCRLKHEDGSWRTLEYGLGAVHDARGEFIYHVAVARDITVRQEEEMKLRLAQKLESMGLLAAGIAHEINTPTQYITDNARFLTTAFAQVQQALAAYRNLAQRAKAAGVLSAEVAAVETAERENELSYYEQEVPRTLEQSLQGLERVSKIVRALKEFSHPGSPLRTPFDVNRAIENAATVCRNEWKYVAELVTDFDPSLPLVPCLADEINQAILNLIINAAHAIADALPKGSAQKGCITLSTRVDGEWAVIAVGDTGTGIPEAIRERIFEPFFTTKPLGKGTGQGLAIVRSVVVGKHQGQVSFETAMGKGTTFTLRLPLKTPPTSGEVLPAA
jgi:two-component system, NtrC family, sensor kinase